jgi:hypothetical protein
MGCGKIAELQKHLCKSAYGDKKAVALSPMSAIAIALHLWQPH